MRPIIGLTVQILSIVSSVSSAGAETLVYVFGRSTVEAWGTARPGIIAAIAPASGELAGELDLGTQVVALAVDEGRGRLYAGVSLERRDEAAVVVLSSDLSSELSRVPLSGRIRDLALSPDQATLWVVAGDEDAGQLLLLDAETLALRQEVALPGTPGQIVFRPGAEQALIPTGSGASVAVVDVETEILVDEIPVGGFARRLAVHPNGTNAWIADSTSSELMLLDLEARVTSGTMPVGDLSGVIDVAVDPAGQILLAVKPREGAVVLVDAGTGAQLASIAVDSPWAVAVDSVGGLAYVARGGECGLSVIDLANRVLAQTTALDLAPVALTVASDAQADLLAYGDAVSPTLAEAGPVVQRDLAIVQEALAGNLAALCDGRLADDLVLFSEFEGALAAIAPPAVAAGVHHSLLASFGSYQEALTAILTSCSGGPLGEAAAQALSSLGQAGISATLALVEYDALLLAYGLEGIGELFEGSELQELIDYGLEVVVPFWDWTLLIADEGEVLTAILQGGDPQLLCSANVAGDQEAMEEIIAAFGEVEPAAAAAPTHGKLTTGAEAWLHALQDTERFCGAQTTWEQAAYLAALTVEFTVGAQGWGEGVALYAEALSNAWQEFWARAALSPRPGRTLREADRLPE